MSFVIDFLDLFRGKAAELFCDGTAHCPRRLFLSVGLPLPLPNLPFPIAMIGFLYVCCAMRVMCNVSCVPSCAPIRRFAARKPCTVT